MFINTLVLSGLATVGSAHILMTNPVPYGKSSLSNSPMAAGGADFPCKMRKGVYELEGASNVYEQGSTQKLALQGSAVHGGGSCQISITTDLEPNKDSDWRTIKSIEGGCPAKGVTGNLGGGAEAEAPDKYDFTIPKELASGNYTMAWTWFNKVGNREMYMNCAPLTVTGSGGSSGFLSTLPEMFVANVGNDCSTKETKDVLFPNPGKDVDRFNGATSVFESPIGSCQKPTGGNGGNGGGSSPTAGQPAPTTAPAATQAPAPSGNPGNPGNPGKPGNPGSPSKSSKTIPGGAFITVSSKQPAATIVAPSNGTAPSSTKVSQPAAPTSSAGPNPAPTSGNGGGNGNSPSTGYAPYTPCTSEGSWNCIAGTSFQRCASGSWSPVLGMPAGVSCTPGESAVIEMNAKNTKRAMRAMRRSLQFNV